jgi:transposase InsO family protein
MVEGIGRVSVSVTDDEGMQHTVTINNVWYAPEAPARILSVLRMAQNGYTVTSNDKQAVITSAKGYKLTQAVRNRTYILKTTIVKPKAYLTKENEDPTIDLWHKRLGHVNIDTLKYMFNHNKATGISINSKHSSKQCIACVKAKTHRQPQSKKPATRATKPGELVHTDTFGPTRVGSHQGHRYIVIFVDDYSRDRWVEFCKTKDEVLPAFQKYLIRQESQGISVKRIHSDGAKEFMTSSAMEKLCLQKGIKQTTSAPYTQAQNGVAERSWRTIMESVRSMMIATRMLKTLWPYAVRTATHLLNLKPTKANKMISPHEILTGKPPDVSNLRVLGCKVHVLIHENRDKLEAKTWEGTFVGYDTQSKSYLVFNSKTLGSKL